MSKKSKRSRGTTETKLIETLIRQGPALALPYSYSFLSEINSDTYEMQSLFGGATEKNGMRPLGEKCTASQRGTEGNSRS